MHNIRRFVWPWFVVGFVFTFVGIAFLKTVRYMHTSGEAIATTKLWRFYLMKMPTSTEMKTLGPATVNGDVLPWFVLSHTVASIIGGLVIAVVARWTIRRQGAGGQPPVSDLPLQNQ
jgi:hypothetical protein